MKFSWLARLFVTAVVVACAAAVEAGPFSNRYMSRAYSWHDNYYDPAWGPQPHALVVPPNTHSHVEYNWGVGGTEWLPIPHQYRAGYTGAGSIGAGPFLPMPVQPSSTRQMGVYYIRAPW
jgi:hypothetical protein